MNRQESNIGRRDFLQMSAGGIVAASAGGSLAQASTANQSTAESSDGIVSQPSPQFAPDLTTADIMVETLISWGATHCFGVVGDGIKLLH